MAEVATEEARCGYCPPASPASLSFPPYRSISVVPLPPEYLPLSICLGRQEEFSVLTHRRALVCARAPPGAAANEATAPSHVYAALGLLIRGIRGATLRMSQPGRRSARISALNLSDCCV